MELELWKMKQEEEFIKGLKWVPLSLSLFHDDVIMM